MSNGNKIGLVLSVVLAVAFSTSVFAAGFRNPPEGAATLGRASGRIALADDASAISANPANLSGLKGSELLVSVMAAHSETEYSGVSGSGTTREPWKLLPSAFAVWPTEREGVVAGLGITTPFGQSMAWEKDGPFRYTAPHFVEVRLLDFKPTVAFPVGDTVSIGVGADLVWSDLEFQQIYPWSSVTGVPATPDGEVRFTGDGTALGGSAAIAWRFSSKQRVALTYRAPFDVEYQGNVKLRGQPPMLPPAGDFNTKIKYPAVWGFGYGIDLTDKIRAGVDIEWIEFSRYKNLDLDVGPYASLLPSTSIPQDWNDTWSFGAGIDWTLTEQVIVRAGYTFLESPVPDETLAPTLPDADRHALSLGAGYRKGGHRVDVAGVVSLYEDRDISSNQNPAYNGKYENSATMVALSYGYAF